MYALDTISFPGFCGSYEEIHGLFQSHYVDFIVKHHVNHFGAFVYKLVHL